MADKKKETKKTHKESSMEPARLEFDKCEICGGWPGLIRWYNGKCECGECSRKSIRKYLLALPVLAALGLLLFLF